MKKILGLGNALVDIITEVDDEVLLKEFNLPKGSMTLVDEKFSKEIFSKTEKFNKTKASGGSAANTIHGLAKLGSPVSFVGKVGSDELGDFFYNDMKENNIVPLMIKGKTDTGKAQAFITRDAERTFATYLGAAVEMTAKDIEEKLFDEHDLVYVEGYLVQNHELLEHTLKMAKDKGLEVALDLASYNVVEDNLDFLRKMVSNYVDIIFANEEEAQAYTGEPDPEKALLRLATETKIAIVKVGKKGSLIRHKNQTFTIKINPEKGIDTTGAGDLYAAGFLHGYIQNLPMTVCGELGSLLAGNVIKVIGAKIEQKNWADIKIRARQLKENARFSGKSC